MNIEFSTLEDAGDLARERIVLKVADKDDIGEYAIFNARLGKTGKIQSGPVRDAYWFVDKDVKKGDLIVLYTKDGETSEKKNDDDTMSYFFYWRKTSPIWVAGRIPVLVSTPTWKVGRSIVKA